LGRMAEELKGAVLRAAGAHYGCVQTSVPGLWVMRFDAPRGLMHEVYTSVLCLVLQGAKQVTIGDGAREYVAGQALVVSVDMPVVSHVTRASREEPYLALAMDLEPSILHELAGQVAAKEFRDHQPGPILSMEETGEDLIDCAARLIGLAERPEAEPILRPGIVREMHYVLLSGRLGTKLRRLARPDSHVQRIARAVALLRREFSQPLPIDALAAVAMMSPSSFHQHFKAVTSYSPLQFQKQLRLLEARRLMVSEDATARSAAFAVGYESTPQFTRDYAKRFGSPPCREIKASRHAANRPEPRAGVQG